MLINDSFQVPLDREVDLSQTFLVYGPADSDDKKHILLSKSAFVAISRTMLTSRQVHPATLEDTGNPPATTSLTGFELRWHRMGKGRFEA